MGAVTAIALAGLGLDRIVGRWAPGAGVRDAWLRGRRHAAAYVRSAPATYAYLTVLFATTWALAVLGDRVANRVLLAQSTNLDHLGRQPVRVLVGSALWAPSPVALVLCAVLFTLVLAPVERRIGSLRTMGIFAAGHLGASLLVGAGLWVALRLDAVEHDVVHARDVGTSYGVFAVAAAMTYLVDRRLRPAYAAALLAYLAAPVVLGGGFGSYGHLVAAGLGFACRPLVARAPRGGARPALGISFGRVSV